MQTTFLLHKCVCVCVCMCDRDRGGRRGKEKKRSVCVCDRGKATDETPLPSGCHLCANTVLHVFCHRRRALIHRRECVRACVCVSVCVCVSENESEREGAGKWKSRCACWKHTVCPPGSTICLQLLVFLCGRQYVCVCVCVCVRAFSIHSGMYSTFRLRVRKCICKVWKHETTHTHARTHTHTRGQTETHMAEASDNKEGPGGATRCPWGMLGAQLLCGVRSSTVCAFTCSKSETVLRIRSDPGSAPE